MNNNIMVIIRYANWQYVRTGFGGLLCWGNVLKVSEYKLECIHSKMELCRSGICI